MNEKLATEAETAEDSIKARHRQMSDGAMTHYHDHFNNETYLAATEGKGVKYANALIDECMALCGHPRFNLSNRRWSGEALDHLANFC